MLVFVVAAVVVAVVVTAIVLRETLRGVAFCPRRESMVEIVGGRCRDREGAACANAPAGCENECLPVSHLARRAS